MYQIKIKDIKLVYDDIYKEKIKDIVKIIETNYLIFADISNKTLVFKDNLIDSDMDCFLVTDFDAFFDSALASFLKKYKNELVKKEVLAILYCEFLVISSLDDKTKFMINENDLYTILALNYFGDNFDSLRDFLKYRNDKEVLFNWLQENYRFLAYNYFLNIIADKIKEDDPTFWQYFDIILKNMIDFVLRTLPINDILTENNLMVPHVSIAKIETLFLDFLRSIDAPDEWYNLYSQLKNDGLISYGNEKSRCFLDEDDQLKIEIEYDGTIETFISLVHEFIHYISFRKGKGVASLEEFPPIYFESLATFYLKQIGLSDKLIKKISDRRNINNFFTYSSIFNLLEDISTINNSGPITKKQKIAEKMDQNRHIEENLLALQEKEGTDSFESIFKFTRQNREELESYVNMACDEAIKILFTNSGGILGGFQYVVDTYLVQILNKLPKEEVIPKMFEVTTNLVNYNMISILKYFGIEEEFKRDDTR